LKIAVLTRAPRCYSTRRLVEAARARGHSIKPLDTLAFSISLRKGQPDLHYQGRPTPVYDAVVPRIGASITHFGAAVVRQFQQMDVYVANTANAILNARDKLRSLQILSRHNVGIPTTEFVRRREDVLPAIERVGGAPVIIKLLEGTQGVGVILADTIKIAEAIIETLQSARQNVLIQKFVSESRGRDVRAIVAGDRVVAAMRRVAQGQEFRSNVHRGGRAEPLELPEAYERVAVRATQILGLRVAGVDMLEGADGPQVAEVNASPGLEGVERATGLDVAGAIVDHIVEHTLFPELDIRERLTVSRGYGVCEVPVGPNSPLRGKTLAESGLGDRDILVLTINHKGAVTPTPRSSRVIEPGDTLLCFGKLESIRSLLPPRARRRRRTGQRR